jgi:hypothetical protein
MERQGGYVCPCCGKESVRYADEGGVLFFHRFGEGGQMLDGMVAVINVPLWVCETPACLWGRPVDEANERINQLADDKGEEAVRRFYG